MTREEALHKLNSIDGSERNYVLLKKLEALELIKFEEEKKELAASTVMLRSINKLGDYIDISRVLDVIRDLDKAGYRIVRKD